MRCGPFGFLCDMWCSGEFRYLCEDVVCLAEDPAGVGVGGDQ